MLHLLLCIRLRVSVYTEGVYVCVQSCWTTLATRLPGRCSVVRPSTFSSWLSSIACCHSRDIRQTVSQFWKRMSLIWLELKLVHLSCHCQASGCSQCQWSSSSVVMSFARWYARCVGLCQVIFCFSYVSLAVFTQILAILPSGPMSDRKTVGWMVSTEHVQLLRTSSVCVPPSTVTVYVSALLCRRYMY